MLHALARPALSIAALAALGACASADDRYPSLAVRDIERVEGRFTPAPAAQEPVPPSPALIQSLDALREQARAAHARFVQAAPRTRRLVEAARGGAADSNRAIDAQVALSALESLRSQTALALGDADALYVEAATQGLVNPPLEETRALIVDLVADEDTTLATLRGQIGR